MRHELNENLKKAIKAQDKPRISTLRLINAAIKDRDIAVRSEAAQKWLDGREPKRIIAVPNKLVNIVI